MPRGYGYGPITARSLMYITDLNLALQPHHPAAHAKTSTDVIARTIISPADAAPAITSTIFKFNLWVG